MTPHFTLEELTRSSTASRLGICNEPGIEAISNLQNLCQEVLEPLRQHLDRPVIITSGYRCTALNRAVGGSPSSQHLRGEAADIRIHSRDEGREMMRFIIASCTFDQLIWEHKANGVQWLHISCRRRGRNRKQFSTSDFSAELTSSETE